MLAWSAEVRWFDVDHQPIGTGTIWADLVYDVATASYWPSRRAQLWEHAPADAQGAIVLSETYQPIQPRAVTGDVQPAR